MCFMQNNFELKVDDVNGRSERLLELPQGCARVLWGDPFNDDDDD